MNYSIALQLANLRDKEVKIDDLHKEIAHMIYVLHPAQEFVYEKRIELFSLIDDVIAKYDTIFVFSIAYDKRDELNMIKKRVASWIEDEYPRES